MRSNLENGSYALNRNLPHAEHGVLAGEHEQLHDALVDGYDVIVAGDDGGEGLQGGLPHQQRLAPGLGREFVEQLVPAHLCAETVVCIFLFVDFFSSSLKQTGPKQLLKSIGNLKSIIS